MSPEDHRAAAFARAALHAPVELLDSLRVGWLRELLSQYRIEHDWNADPDPDSTGEMLAMLEAWLPRLELVFPDPAMCDLPTGAHAASEIPF